MQKNKTYWVILLFISILFLDMLIMYFIYSKKPSAYIITQDAAIPLTLSSEIKNSNFNTQLYYYTVTPNEIKFYDLAGNLLMDKKGKYSIFGIYDQAGNYLVSEDKSLFVINLHKKEMNEILVANSKIVSAIASPENEFITYVIENKNNYEIWQYDLDARDNKFLTSIPSEFDINLLDWIK
ncbi:hypothetical protein JW977_02815 [Candidatus Falkowbacteria bacterium]|nr:hypothetical protein [Candidatus Falkowbacteria bacterium]